ncbi:MAG: hypothetical protein IKF29_00485 [Oceanobacillus sp.]|nr:hypothetical protein [Oceanobacillus sp.]
MNKEITLKLFLELADSFIAACENVDASRCTSGKCPFSKKRKNGDYACIFEDKGMNTPYNWITEAEDERNNS